MFNIFEYACFRNVVCDQGTVYLKDFCRSKANNYPCTHEMYKRQFSSISHLHMLYYMELIFVVFFFQNTSLQRIYKSV